jgi:hypothetical protein
MMRTIERLGSNANGVSVFRMEYLNGVWNARISAPVMEVGDIFDYFNARMTVKTIENARPHKTDDTVMVYDCTLGDVVQLGDPAKILNLIQLRLPDPSVFLSKEDLEKWIASHQVKKSKKLQTN